jgi:hypothetical protein
MVGTLDNEIYFWGLKGEGGPTVETEGGEAGGNKASKIFQMAKTKEGWQMKANDHINVAIWQPILVLRWAWGKGERGREAKGKCQN